MNLKFLIRIAGNIMGLFTKTKNTLNMQSWRWGEKVMIRLILNMLRVEHLSKRWPMAN